MPVKNANSNGWILQWCEINLLFLIIITTFVILLLSSLDLLPLDTTSTTATEGTCKGKVDVLLTVKTNDEWRNVDDLLSNSIAIKLAFVLADDIFKESNIPDVSLTDENTSVVNRFGKTKLVDTSLKTTLQEIFDLEGQDVIELHAGFIEHTNTDETTNQSITFEKSLWVFLIESKKFTGPKLVQLEQKAEYKV
jgi:hypothetical protein